jgi:phage shock protein C
MSKSDNGSQRLRLSTTDRKLLGVCAGFAHYLDVPPALVRLIYLIACLVSPVLIIVYFVLYWCLKEEDSPSKMRVYVSESETAQHFKRIDYRRPLYRNPQNAKIAGVCSGIAEYLNISPFIVRVVTLISLFLLGAVTFWAYVVCWIVLDKKPKQFRYPADDQPPVSSDNNPESASPETVSLRECADVLARAEARLREVEAYMTSKQFRLHCEINRI